MLLPIHDCRPFRLLVIVALGVAACAASVVADRSQASAPQASADERLSFSGRWNANITNVTLAGSGPRMPQPSAELVRSAARPAAPNSRRDDSTDQVSGLDTVGAHTVMQEHLS
jgi:hypothetical protein